MTTPADLPTQVGLSDGRLPPQYRAIVELVTEKAERDS